MNDQIGARLVYQNAQAALRSAGLSQDEVENAVLSQSFLRFETLLNATSNQYFFPILNNQTQGGIAVRSTEKRLNLQDAVYVAEIGIYLTKAASATATNLLLNTYPNAITYATGAANLETFYNGSLQLAVNNSVIIPALDTMRFRQVPQTQLTGATNSPEDEFDAVNNRSAMISIEPNVVLIGSKNSQLVLTLPAAIGALDANTYAVIIMRGILAQNVTVVS